MLTRRRMLMQAGSSEVWDYIIYPDSDTGKIPVKLLNMVEGQTITVRVLNLTRDTGNLYYATSGSGVSPRNLKVSSVWAVKQGTQDYSIQVPYAGVVRLSSGTNNADGDIAYYGFYADALYVRIS